MNTTVAIRVDASSQIGTGHVMRCLTLARALKKNGVEIVFVSKHMQDSLSALILSYGFTIRKLGYELNNNLDELTHASWLGASQDDDAIATIEALCGLSVDWIIVDHYALDYRWHKKLKLHTKKVMVIDDIADRKHDCDILLDQNYYTNMDSRYKNKVPDTCKVLLGPKYALLRDEFLEARKSSRQIKTEVKNILINFGGVDPENYTEKVINVLSKIVEYEFNVDIVIGTQHPNKVEIENLCLNVGYNCHVQTNKMAELIANSDMGIGAGGATSWERCALGLPTLTFSIAENQKDIVQHAVAAGLAYSPEIRCDQLLSNLAFHVKEFISNAELRTKISLKSLKMVDGLGVDRVTKAMGF